MALTESSGGGVKGLAAALAVIALAVVIWFGTKGKTVDDPPRPWHSETPAPTAGK
jgi:hypothetical protein